MNTKSKNIVIVVTLLVVAVGIWWSLKPGIDSCEYTESAKTGDRDFQPMLTGESKVIVQSNYYKCNPAVKGEVARYTLGQENEYYYRVIVATEGDIIQVPKDPNGRGWNLIVNDKLVKAGAGAYFFGVPGSRPPLSLYLQPDGKKTLDPGQLVLFSSGAPGFNDSGVFGLFNAKDLKGRVQLESERQKMLNDFVATLYATEDETVQFLSTIPKKELAKKPTVTRNKPVAPVTKKPNQRQPKKNK